VTKDVDRAGVREIVFLLLEFLNQKGEQLGQALLFRGAFFLAQ
jgi:hypothetical protein